MKLTRGRTLSFVIFEIASQDVRFREELLSIERLLDEVETDANNARIHKLDPDRVADLMQFVALAIWADEVADDGYRDPRHA